jgi:hypothetical protein
MVPAPEPTEVRTLYWKLVVPRYGDPKMPAPEVSARVVAAVVMLIADSGATTTDRVLVPVAANWPKSGNEAPAKRTEQ